MKKLLLLFFICALASCLAAQGIGGNGGVGGNGGFGGGTTGATATFSVLLTVANTCHTTAAASLTCNATSTVTSGTNLGGFCAVSIGNAASGPTISGVTWGGTSMTSAGAQGTQSNVTVSFWWITTGITTGTPSIVATLSASETNDIFVQCFTATHVNQTNPVRSGSYTVSGAHSTGANITLTIPSQSSDIITTLMATPGGPVTNTTAGENTLGITSNGSRIIAALDWIAGTSPNVVDTWTFPSAAAVMIGFSIAGQ